MMGSYRSRAWWFDQRNVLHWVTNDALQRWFNEAPYKPNTAWTGGSTVGYSLGFLYSCAIGANVDGSTSPAQACSKPWTYGPAPKGGRLLISSGVGGIWWMQPDGYGGYIGHWVRNQTLAAKFWGPGLTWRYPPPTGPAWWGRNEDLDPWPLGPNIDLNTGLSR
ncbi:MAG: hypothetical protein HY290_22525 [Planctomycetia bacterium]|nr:hypothetical protein [Planctomycetia bacterium]